MKISEKHETVSVSIGTIGRGLNHIIQYVSTNKESTVSNQHLSIFVDNGNLGLTSKVESTYLRESRCSNKSKYMRSRLVKRGLFKIVNFQERQKTGAPKRD